MPTTLHEKKRDKSKEKRSLLTFLSIMFLDGFHSLFVLTWISDLYFETVLHRVNIQFSKFRFESTDRHLWV